MVNKKEIKYIDYQGNQLFDHDGTLIVLNDRKEIQYFDINGQGFIHDGAPIKMKNGTMQFFLHDGKALIHDGSPLKLPDGQTQYFNENGYAMWPINAERMNQLNNEQREVFFKTMLKRVSIDTPLTDAETENLRLALLAAEHPNSEEGKNILWCKDIHSTGLEPVSLETAHILMTLEVIWLRVLTKYKFRHKEALTARFTINWLKKNDGCQLAKMRSAESMLVEELGLELKKAEKFINPPTDFESSYKKPPALTLFSWGMVTTPFKVKLLKADEEKIFDQDNKQIGIIKQMPTNGITAIDASTISNILTKRNIELLKSVNFHRLFRWEIKEVTKRYLSGVADFRKLTIEDSFRTLATLISASTNPKTIQELREIVAWQQQATFALGDGNMGHMLTYDIRSNPNDKRKKILSLYLTDMLLPNFVFSMPHQNQSQRDERLLAPLLDMPPLVTDNNKLHAAQAAFQVELCIEMRKRAKEIVERGGIHLPYEKKIVLAETVGLDRETLPKVFDRWTQDGNDGPKMLDEIEKDVYNLSEHHQAARDFIIAAGKMEKSASLAGKKSRKTFIGKLKAPK